MKNYLLSFWCMVLRHLFCIEIVNLKHYLGVFVKERQGPHEVIQAKSVREREIHEEMKHCGLQSCFLFSPFSLSLPLYLYASLCHSGHLFLSFFNSSVLIPPFFLSLSLHLPLSMYTSLFYLCYQGCSRAASTCL